MPAGVVGLMVLDSDALMALDERFRGVQERAGIPGVAWGVVREGTLAHAGGAGTLRAGEALVPDPDSIFRIASMTKSFTATAILMLRDAGLLRLDDPAAAYVPQLASWTGPTEDAGPITIRQLLTMSAGLPSDDPWGDRQQGMPLDRFAALLEAAPTFAWPPGTWFEYSNLGYAVLGRIVTAASGREYREYVGDSILEPLGMRSTGFREEDLPSVRLAHGYVRRDDGLVREGRDGYGAFASMGGVYSTVRDLATWVSGFLDAFPARDDPDDNHPLRRASRREMQQQHRALPGSILGHAAHEAPTPRSAGYGFGLFITSSGVGACVSHGGGYPGFGSHMAWHPGTGLGVIALGNSRYAPVHEACVEGLEALVGAAIAPRRPLRMLPVIESLRDLVESLLRRWDDTAADAAFAMNMDLDEPRAGRRAAAERLAAELGPFRRDPDRPVVADSPAHLSWWLRGSRGWVQASILVSPEAVPRLQKLTLVGVPDPPAAVEDVARRLLAASGLAGAALPASGLAGAALPAWPPDVPIGPKVDVQAIRRSLLAAVARLGELRLGLPTAGDGSTAATFEVFGDSVTPGDAGVAAPATLEVSVDPDAGTVTMVALRITDREAPVEAW